MPTSESGITAELLDALQRGERRALDQLLALHRGYLKRLIEVRLDPNLRGRLDPSDVVQETLVAASHRIQDFLARRPTSFRIWLRRKAIERLVDQRRFHRRKRRDVASELSVTDPSSLAIARGVLSGSGHIMRRELIQQVRTAMSRLSPNDCEVLLLRHAEELSNAEIAEVLEIDPKAASARYGRAILRLSIELRKLGIDAR